MHRGNVWVSPVLAEAMKTILQRTTNTERTFDPEEKRAAFANKQAESEIACKSRGNSAACIAAAGYQRVSSSLSKGIALAPACGAAQRAYGPYYPHRDAPKEIASAFDISCLGSLVPRKSALGVVPPDTLPPILQGTTLNSIGLLMHGEEPLCAGLLRNDRTMVTAGHCFTDREIAWARAKELWVLPLSNGHSRWAIAANPIERGEKDSQLVADNWAVLKIDTADETHAEEATFETPAIGEVVVIAAYLDFRKTDYVPTPGTPVWMQSVRFPKSGFCQVTDYDDPCVHIVCQTIKGFSGTPIFEPTRTPDNKLRVVGFVSGAGSSSGSGCATGITDSTVARSSVGL